ncbi:MAG: PIN domain nuclease [Spirochaetaceae bacterium]|jgi:predicted nucleic acid-binding protein|nr:PIN domain nuclease [Spirochaetaceae bacterium]
MIVADASVWIDYFNNVVSKKTKTLTDALFRGGSVLVGDLIITEVLQGIRDDAKYKATKDFLFGLKYHTLVGKKLSAQAAENYRFLRRRGITIRKTVDVIIGTFCIKYGYPILHKDQDFDFMEQYLGLQAVK